MLAAPVVMTAAFSRPAPAAECVAARVTSEVTTLPAPWRQALDVLVHATGREGRPWSCSGARLALTLEGPEGPARLIITMDDWPVQERSIARPEDLVPVGEALLARPLPLGGPSGGEDPRGPRAGQGRPGDSAASGSRGSPSDAAPSPHAGGPPASPASSSGLGPARLLLDGLGSVRFTSEPGAIWVGGALRAMLPFDAWSVGIWGRFEVAAAELQAVPVDFTMFSGSVGVAGGYRVLAQPVELTAAFEPSLAILSMDGGRDSTPASAFGAKADLRLGARLLAAFPVRSRWRALVAIDGELSPQSLASDRHRTIDPRLPPIPTFTLGASVGGELALR